MSRIHSSYPFVAHVLLTTLLVSAPAIADSPAITLETPSGCASSSPLPVIAHVTGDSPIDSLSWEVEQGSTPVASGTACTACGTDPTRTFDAPLGECDNTVTVTAVDSLGRVATASRVVRFDTEGPILRTDWPWSLVGCRDFTIEVPVPRTLTGGRIHDPTTIPVFEYAVDQCDGWTHATCDDTGPYPVGSVTPVTCVADYAWGDQDQCGNPTQCTFEVDVRRPLHPGCYTHTFWDEDEFNTQPETRGWSRTAIGASEIHSAHLSEHGLWFAAKGPSLDASPGDDLAFLHRPPGASSFRVELPEPDVMAYLSNPWYWASGPMVRWGLAPEDPAVFVSHRPVPPLGFAFHSTDTNLHFTVRRAPGEDLVELASPVPDRGLIALEVLDSRVTVYHSTDGGTTWQIPTGGLGGSTTVVSFAEPAIGYALTSGDPEESAALASGRIDVCTLEDPPPGCEVDDFADGVLDTDWLLLGVGNANQESVVETGGVLELTADGATAFYGADNAGYFFRQVTGNFRFEATIDGTSMTTGGLYRKAGLMVRESLDPWAVRLIAQLAPYWEERDETHLQFVARDGYGEPGRLPVARDVVGVPRVVRLAVERIGDTLTVEYSLDGGATWIRPATGLGGSISVPGLAPTLLVGLDMVSNDISTTSTARFDDLGLCTFGPAL